MFQSTSFLKFFFHVWLVLCVGNSSLSSGLSSSNPEGGSSFTSMVDAVDISLVDLGPAHQHGARRSRVIDRGGPENGQAGGGSRSR